MKSVLNDWLKGSITKVPDVLNTNAPLLENLSDTNLILLTDEGTRVSPLT